MTISHICPCEPANIDVEYEVRAIKNRIENDSELSVDTKNELTALVDELIEFPLGRYLVINKGLNGYWTSYLIRGLFAGNASCSRPVTSLERWFVERAPTVCATRERFKHFQHVLQSAIGSGIKLLSAPCGLMDDLLTLDFTNTSNVSLVGIDLDPYSLQQAQENAKKHSLGDQVVLCCIDAWELPFEEEFDVVTSNGLSIYVFDDHRVEVLYGKFFAALKPGGQLITSTLTPPPTRAATSTWNMQAYKIEDMQLQKKIFSDILQVKWQAYRSFEQTKEQLEKVGFTDIYCIYDKAKIFPTVVARKSV